MTANILLVTPHFGFGQLLKKKLDGIGDYCTTLSSGMSSALTLASQGIYNLAIIDSACVNGSIARISTELRNLNPGIRQLAILHKDQKAAPGIGNIDIDEWLLLPFTIIELYAAVEQVLTDTAQPENTSLQSSGQRTPENTNVDKQSKDLSSPDNSDEAIRWRLTNTSVKTLLEEQMAESGAQAALVIREGKLWAYVGQFLQKAAEKLTDQVIGYWDDRSSLRTVDQKSNDLIRYIQVENYPSESLLYVTRLRVNMVIAVIFASNAHFFEVRSQVKTIVDVLIRENRAQSLLYDEPGIGTSRRGAGDQVESIDHAGEEPPARQDIRVSDRETPWLWAYATEETVSAVSDRERSVEDRIDEGQNNQKAFAHTAGSTGEQGGVEAQYAESIPPNIQQAVYEGTRRGIHTSLLENFTQLSTMEWHILNYACLLIPRMPRHKIIGSLRARLEHWIRDVAIASGWRLDYLTIRPEYLHWITSAPPNLAPLTIIRQVENYTSTLIFQEFPQFALENPSQHFWAPGYVLASEFDPFTPVVIEGFIDHIRQAQGIPGET